MSAMEAPSSAFPGGTLDNVHPTSVCYADIANYVTSLILPQ